MSATLGTGTCHADETETISVRGDTWGNRFDKHFTIHVMECSECGQTYEHVNGDYEYCPRCGRRIEVVGE
jgi:Zn finger protein HypA/HybF involved in hydrogenase expression